MGLGLLLGDRILVALELPYGRTKELALSVEPRDLLVDHSDTVPKLLVALSKLVTELCVDPALLGQLLFESLH